MINFAIKDHELAMIVCSLTLKMILTLSAWFEKSGLLIKTTFADRFCTPHDPLPYHSDFHTERNDFGLAFRMLYCLNNLPIKLSQSY